MAWTSLATGVNPGKHGIFDFITRDPATHLPQLSVPRSSSGLGGGTRYESPILAEPFWRLTSDAGIQTTVMRWPVTFPPDKVKGEMLSGLGVPDVRGFLSGYMLITEREPPAGVKGPHRAVHVERQDGAIDAALLGPKTSEGGANVEAPIKIRFAPGQAGMELVADGVAHPLTQGEWSEWIRVTFTLGPLRKVRGIFKAYVLSAEPFEMYVTSVNVDPGSPIFDISFPKGFSAALASDIGMYATLGMPEETAGYEDGVLPEQALADQIRQVDDERERMFWNAFAEFKAADIGMFAFVFDSSDRLQHLFWNSSAPGEGPATIHPLIEEQYVRMDALVGDVLAQIDGRTLLLIVSDHGFTSFERAVDINRWLVDNGFMVLTQEPPEGEDGALFEYVDWSKTRAYSLGFASIYANLAGREGGGIVQDRETVVAEIVRGLNSLADEGSGTRVVNAYRREDIYSGPHTEDAPDIILGFHPGYRMGWNTPVGGISPDVIADNPRRWKSDHIVDPSFVPGVLFSNARLAQESASQLDVTPTVLDALGIRVPDEMDGGSLLR